MQPVFRHAFCVLLPWLLAGPALAVQPAIPGEPPPAEPAAQQPAPGPAPEPAAATYEKPVVAIFPLPAKDVLPTTQDQITQALANHVISQYGLPVLSGRSVGRAVWGTLGTGLEESSMAFTAKVQEGMQAYNVLQMGKSIDYFEQAKKFLPVCGPEIRDVAVLSDLYLYAGLAYMAQGQTERAADHFRQAVSMQPKLQLSRKRFSPDVRQAFSRARQQVLSGHPDRVRFISEPPGATVYLDGRRIGTTPVEDASIFPGQHFVRLEMEGHAPWTLTMADNFSKTTVQAHLIPIWKDEPPEDLMASGMNQSPLSAQALSNLRKLIDLFQVDALILTSFSRSGQAVHLGVRVFAAEPEVLARPRLFNLGSDPDLYDVKVEGVASTLKQLRRVHRVKRQPKVAIGSAPTDPATPPPFRPISQQPIHPAPIDDPLLFHDDVSSPWYKSWWFWTLAGVVVAGAAVGGYFLFKPEGNWALVIKPVGPTTP